jgi:mannose-6-phosphate isomerase-like protein (cupin superfamily)
VTECPERGVAAQRHDHRIRENELATGKDMPGDPPRPAGVIVLLPEQGRAYEMGFMRAVFKADGAETNDRYSVSEWWMEPRNAGPGAHHHDHYDEVFYVVEGVASILIGEQWVDVGEGSFVRIPAGVTHDFENRTDERMGCSISSSRAASRRTCPPSSTGSSTTGSEDPNLTGRTRFRISAAAGACARVGRQPDSRVPPASMAAPERRCGEDGDRNGR